jgi:hypothetical protein
MIAQLGCPNSSVMATSIQKPLLLKHFGFFVLLLAGVLLPGHRNKDIAHFAEPNMATRTPIHADTTTWRTCFMDAGRGGGDRARLGNYPNMVITTIVLKATCLDNALQSATASRRTPVSRHGVPRD